MGRTAGARTLGLSLLLAAAAAGCGDSPTDPVASQPKAVSSFDVAIRYVGTPPNSVREAVDASVLLWRSAITGDLGAVRLNARVNECFTGQPALDQTVDDLLLFVQVTRIDGPGQALAESGPCYTRAQNSLPVMGVLRLDSADLRVVEIQGLLRDLVTHELGHVLGFGTIWSDLGLLTGAGSPDPRFSGAVALSSFQVLGGGGAGVPVENSGQDGTRESHWRESVFGNEVMTGYINSGPNPLSAVTIGSLKDLGYVTSAAAAQAYTLPRANGVAADVLPSELPRTELVERLLTPLRRIGD